MTLTVPGFIESANVHDVPITYDWGKKVFESIEGYRSKKLGIALAQLSPLANLAFALSVAEWVCSPLKVGDRLPPDPRLHRGSVGGDRLSTNTLRRRR